MALYAAEASGTYGSIIDPDFAVYSSQEAFHTFDLREEVIGRTIDGYVAASLAERALVAYDGDDMATSWIGLLLMDGVNQHLDIRMPYRIEIAGLDKGITRHNDGIVYSTVCLLLQSL